MCDKNILIIPILVNFTKLIQVAKKLITSLLCNRTFRATMRDGLEKKQQRNKKRREEKSEKSIVVAITCN